MGSRVLGKKPYRHNPATISAPLHRQDPEEDRNIQRMKRYRRRGWSYRKIAERFGVSVGLAYEFVNTDLRRWKARALQVQRYNLERSRDGVGVGGASPFLIKYPDFFSFEGVQFAVGSVWPPRGLRGGGRPESFPVIPSYASPLHPPVSLTDACLCLWG